MNIFSLIYFATLVLRATKKVNIAMVSHVDVYISVPLVF